MIAPLTLSRTELAGGEALQGVASPGAVVHLSLDATAKDQRLDTHQLIATTTADVLGRFSLPVPDGTPSYQGQLVQISWWVEAGDARVPVTVRPAPHGPLGPGCQRVLADLAGLTRDERRATHLAGWLLALTGLSLLIILVMVMVHGGTGLRVTVGVIGLIAGGALAMNRLDEKMGAAPSVAPSPSPKRGGKLRWSLPSGPLWRGDRLTFTVSAPGWTHLRWTLTAAEEHLSWHTRHSPSGPRSHFKAWDHHARFSVTEQVPVVEGKGTVTLVLPKHWPAPTLTPHRRVIWWLWVATDDRNERREAVLVVPQD